MAAGLEPTAALAAAYRRRLLHLTARDLTGAASVDEVGEELAGIAAAVLEAALAVARAELPPAPPPPAWPWSPWASAAAASSTTPATST